MLGLSGQEVAEDSAEDAKAGLRLRGCVPRAMTKARPHQCDSTDRKSGIAGKAT